MLRYGDGDVLANPAGFEADWQIMIRVSLRQNGVQVAWIASFIPTPHQWTQRMGLDSHRKRRPSQTIDHHYVRLFGFSALTSMFTAAFAIYSARANQSVLAYPTPGQAASQASRN